MNINDELSRQIPPLELVRPAPPRVRRGRDGPLAQTARARDQDERGFWRVSRVVSLPLLFPLPLLRDYGADVLRRERRYYEGGVCSVYLWDLDEGFAGVVLIKKTASPSTSASPSPAEELEASWDSSTFPPFLPSFVQAPTDGMRTPPAQSTSSRRPSRAARLRTSLLVSLCFIWKRPWRMEKGRGRRRWTCRGG